MLTHRIWKDNFILINFREVKNSRKFFGFNFANEQFEIFRMDLISRMEKFKEKNNDFQALISQNQLKCSHLKILLSFLDLTLQSAKYGCVWVNAYLAGYSLVDALCLYKSSSGSLPGGCTVVFLLFFLSLFFLHNKNVRFRIFNCSIGQKNATKTTKQMKRKALQKVFFI